MEFQKVTIVGAGEIGRALGLILSKNGHEVKLWDKDPDVTLGENYSLPDIVREADVVFMCVPSRAMREALLFVNPYLLKKTIVVSVAKGLEEKTLLSMEQLLKALLPRGQKFCVLGGAILAEEIGAGLLGEAVAGAIKKETAQKIAELFAGSNIACGISTDLRGVALSGVLKNIYALGLGIGIGLGWGDNAKGSYIVRSASEMAKIVKKLGGKEGTALSVAGLGDLVATGFSPYSANYQLGRDLAEGKTGPASEGYTSIASMVSLLGKKYSDLKILTAIYAVAVENKDPQVAFANILK